MITVTQFAKIAGQRKGRKPYSRTYIHLLIKLGKIKPTPERAGGVGIFLLDPKSVITK